MAYNALYGFDTSQPLGTSMAPSYNAYNPRFTYPNTSGYGGMAPSYDAFQAPPGRQYPKWMTDITARGIGVGQNWTGSTPAAIDVPRGDGSGGFGGAVAAPVAPTMPQYDYGGMGTEGLSGVRSYDVAEGGGANPGFGGDGVTGFAGGGGSYSFSDLLSALGFGSDPASGSGPSSAQQATGSGFPGSVQDGSFGSGFSNDGMFGSYDGSFGPGSAMDAAPATASFEGGFGGGDSGGGGGMGGGMSGGDMGGMGGMEGFSHGGHVTRNRLHGPDPVGPDDGYAALNIGEGIITAKAMKHYGKGILSRLNKLQVPKEAFGKK